MVSSFIIFDIAAIALASWIVERMLDRRKLGPLPPGPKPLPFIGNVLDLPEHRPWETFWEWGQRYGPLVHLSLFGQPMIIINSHEVATDLLDKRSGIYSGRQHPPSSKIIGYTNGLPLVQYGDDLRDQRRMVSQTMGSRALAEKYGPLEEQEARLLVQRILRDPASERSYEHAKTYTGAIMLLLTYGYQINRHGKDEMLEKAFSIVETFGEAMLPGAFLADIIPALRYVPSWFPGTGWQRKAQRFSEMLHRTKDETYQFTKDQVALGTALPSIASRNIEAPGLTPEREHQIKWAGIGVVGAGIDTSVATVYIYFLVATLYPEIQRKAQAEIDAVVGRDRLPTFQDRDNLPYINAICKEMFRWMPAGPFGVPHLLSQDDEYGGYVFPKGTVFISNIWGMLHDPARYPNPFEFDPERHLSGTGKVQQQDPYEIVFGYGRRICPGMHVADASIYIVVAHFVASFNVEKKVKNGVPVTPVARQTSGLISRPEDYECDIKPRHPQVEHLIQTANESREHDLAFLA